MGSASHAHNLVAFFMFREFKFKNQWNFQEDVMKKFQEFLAPLLLLGLMLATLPKGSSAQEV